MRQLLFCVHSHHYNNKYIYETVISELSTNTLELQHKLSRSKNFPTVTKSPSNEQTPYKYKQPPA